MHAPQKRERNLQCFTPLDKKLVMHTSVQNGPKRFFQRFRQDVPPKLNASATEAGMSGSPVLRAVL
jgi:hypothetical protein